MQGSPEALASIQTIRRRAQRSADLNAAIIDQVLTLFRPEPLRLAVAFDALTLTLEHHGAIATLCHFNHYASSHALLRPIVETQAQGLWLLYAADFNQIERLAAGTFKPLLSYFTKMLEKKKPFPAAAQLRRFDLEIGKVLNSFTHNGLEQLRRRAEGFQPQEINMCLIIADGTALMAADAIAEMHNAVSLRTLVFDRTREMLAEHGKTSDSPERGLPPIPSWHDPVDR